MEDSGPEHLRPPIRLLQTTAFVSTFDRFAMPPMLVAIAHDLEVPLGQVVHAAGAYFLAYGLMQPVWGIVSDRLGRVTTMRLTLFLACLSTIASAFTSTPLALGIARALAGGFMAAAYPATLVYLGDTVPAARRQPEITRLMVGVAMGTALASLGAGALAQLLTWRVAFVLSGLAALVLVVALRNLPEPTHPPRAHLLSPLVDVVRSRTAVLVLALAFAEGVVLLGVLTLLPSAVQTTGSGATVAGAVTGVFGVAVLFSAPVLGRLSRTRHPSRLIALGASSALLACTLLAISRTATVAILVAVLIGLAWTSMHSSLQTWATEVAPDARAAVVSLFAGSLFAGSATAAIAVAGLAEAERYREIFVLAALVAIPLGAVGTVARLRWTRPGQSTA